MTDRPTASSARVRTLHDLIRRAVSDGDETTLQTMIDTLLGTCVSERDAVERMSQAAADWKDKGDTVRRALCEGHACGRLIAVERIEEDLLHALELTNQYEKVTAGLLDDEPSYLPTVVSEQVPSDAAGRDRQVHDPTIVAYLLVNDTTGRWLVVRDTNSPTDWRLPGRIVRADDESPAAVAIAATAKHTGLQLTSGPLIAARWIGTAGTLALIFSAFVLDRAAVNHTGHHAWQMVSPQFAQSRLHPLIDQALADIPMSGPILYREQTSPHTNASGHGRRGIRTAAHRILDGSTIEGTYPCCRHRGARLTPADVARLDADPDQSVRRRCDSCGTPYDVYLIGPASDPQSLEWLHAV